MAELAWVAAALPFFSFLIQVFITGPTRRRGDWVGIIATAASFILSIGVLLETTAGVRTGSSFLWATMGDRTFRFGYHVDALTGVMLVVVALVSLMVHLFSLGYMEGDVRYGRYYTILSLFTFSMLGLLLADNFLQLFVFWELVGLCSFLLIGHWYEEKANSNAAMKAFLTTRVGDIGMAIGIFLLYSATGTLQFEEVWHSVSAGLLTPATITAVSLLLFAGAVGKSAQFPLHVWLPDAMAGPTPVSALIHAATMVAAGVYLVARSFPLFSASPTAMYWVAAIGGFTAFFAATIALVQEDIKKVLAYSTISQLGYMFLGLGSGSLVAGTFHLMTQAFFKSLLFLASGSVIHALHTQNLHEMGGLYRRMRWTAWTWIIGSLAMAGVPPLSGFWSKDEVLLAAYHSGRPLLFWLGLITALLTAFYITRATWLAFFGRPRDEEKFRHAHEGDWRFKLPLGVLAIMAAFSGFVGSSWFGHPFTHWMETTLPSGFHLVELEPAGIVQLLALAAAVLGILLGWLVYGAGVVSRSALIRAAGPVYTLLKRKYYLDELYGWLFVRTTVALSWVVSVFDRYIVDGIVNLIAWFSTQLSFATGDFDRSVIDGAVNGVGAAFSAGSQVLRRAQTGYVGAYLLVLLGAMAAGLLVLAFIVD
ncbi:MAG: NADH-quinone oxidoreductase subunit L [Limnochordales bacterium]|nr:NADH-quinone oxidoreductase subunit L [Limnochordales bacterium]